MVFFWVFEIMNEPFLLPEAFCWVCTNLAPTLFLPCLKDIMSPTSMSDTLSSESLAEPLPALDLRMACEIIDLVSSLKSVSSTMLRAGSLACFTNCRLRPALYLDTLELDLRLLPREDFLALVFLFCLLLLGFLDDRCLGDCFERDWTTGTGPLGRSWPGWMGLCMF